MVSVNRRLEDLEARMRGRDTTPPIPIKVRVHCMAVQRYQAIQKGLEPPHYTPEEIEALRAWDIETVEGRGTEAKLRASAGWRSEEEQALLDEWEEAARRRLEAVEGLPPERWAEVWGADEEEEAAM